GVERQHMKSLWTPNTRWLGVTEEGLEGGPVISGGYDGSAASLVQLRANVARSGEIGQIVARDEGSTVIYVPLLSTMPDGRLFDYAEFAERVEQMRVEHESAQIKLHITGFAK